MSNSKEITESDIAETEEFIEIEEQVQQYQHETVEDAVNAYVTDMNIEEGDVVATVEVPAYEETVERKVADVSGGLNSDTNLTSYVYNVDRIADVAYHNPYPAQKQGGKIQILDQHGEYKGNNIDRQDKQFLENEKESAKKILTVSVPAYILITGVYFTHPIIADLVPLPIEIIVVLFIVITFPLILFLPIVIVEVLRRYLVDSYKLWKMD